MRRHQLSESLLSSSHYVMQDKPHYLQEKDRGVVEAQDLNLQRLYRKFNQSLPELQREQLLKKSRPLLCPFIFSPQSKFIIAWQILNIILIYIYFMQIPIILAFENHRSLQNNQRFFQILNLPTIIIFLLGIFINLNTAFYQDGLLKNDPQQIRTHYYKKNLFFDLLSIFTIVLYQILEISKSFDSQGWKLFVGLFYLKIFQLLSTENTIISSFDLNRRIKAILKLFLLLMKILLVCNAAACSAFYISYYLANYSPVFFPDGSQCTDQCFWVIHTTYAGKSLLEYQDDFVVQYIYSLYWASTTMISIGYGDITPKNPSEVGFTVFVQFLSCLLFGYSINRIWSIIQELNAKKSKIHSRLNLINLYMRDKDIGAQLTSRVNAYLNNYYYAKNLREREMQAEIIAELTPALRSQLFYQSYSVIFRHPYFSRTSLSLRQALCSQVKQVGYYQAELIFVQKQPCLYYVKKGQLSYRSGQNSRTFVKNLYSKDCFGIYQFFTQLHFRCQLRATTYSLLFYLKANHWRTILPNYPNDFQRYYETKDELLLYSHGSVIAYRCQFCCGRDHRTEDCLRHQLNRTIIETLKLYKVQRNSRRFYPRRQFKEKHQRHERKRKSTMKGSDSRLLSKLSFDHQSHSRSRHHHLYDQPSRKSSIEQITMRKGKANIKNVKNQQESLRALEKLQREHRMNPSEESQESESVYEMRFEEVGIDCVCEYQEYYPQFNISELLLRENARRRITRII